MIPYIKLRFNRLRQRGGPLSSQRNLYTTIRKVTDQKTAKFYVEFIDMMPLDVVAKVVEIANVRETK